jgi:hypothetical protein
MTENNEPTQYKTLSDINLKELANEVSLVMSKHLGGTFSVEVTSFVTVDRTPGGISDIYHVRDITFRVQDDSWISRMDVGRSEQ